MKKIGIDVGGTFTDSILMDEETGQIWVGKVSSTPANPAQGAVEGILEICRTANLSPEEIERVYHGTTVATNTLIEHQGARVGMITTKGFRDVIHIARGKKVYNFSLSQDLPWQTNPICRRRYRIPVAERVIPPEGEVLVPLEEEEVRRAIRTLKAEGIEAVAVCFLFSFLNPQHEQRVKEIVLEEYPEVFLSLRSELIPQIKEFESFNTTAINCYLGPGVGKYIQRFDHDLKESHVKGLLRLMQSHGGMATQEAAQQRPVSLLCSGPVAGLMAAIWLAESSGLSKNIISLDVGGTSADVGVAPQGAIRTRALQDSIIGGYHVMVPMIDIDTIGAGGGSIAYLDPAGIFRVGPKSAGADPGPACYGQGGKSPAATDAMLTLGLIGMESPFAGKLTLKKELSLRAIEDHLARPLGMEVPQAAMGMLQILTHNMVRSIELNSVRRGYDPREFALVAFGGAGPIFACGIAREMSIPQIIIPPYPGVTSAMGLLATDVSYEYVKTILQRSSSLHLARVQAVAEELEAEVFQRLREDGFPEKEIVVQRVVDCRYLDQGYELRIPAAGGPIDEGWAKDLMARFHRHHEQEYGHQFEHQEVQLVNLRAVGLGKVKKIRFQEIPGGTASPREALKGHRDVFLGEDQKLKVYPTPCYDRRSLRAGNQISGPAIVEQEDSTIFIQPGFSAAVDPWGNLLIASSH